MYLMKIQTSFLCKKLSKSIFNENTDLFCMQKNFKYVFNENTDLFLNAEKFQTCI